jgi:hypothetical protein
VSHSDSNFAEYEEIANVIQHYSMLAITAARRATSASNASTCNRWGTSSFP